MVSPHFIWQPLRATWMWPTYWWPGGPTWKRRTRWGPYHSWQVGAVPLVCCNRVFLTSICIRSHLMQLVIVELSLHAGLSQWRPVECFAMGIICASVFLVVCYFLFGGVGITCFSVDSTLGGMGCPPHNIMQCIYALFFMFSISS